MKIIVDFDNTIADSAKEIINIYNYLYDETCIHKTNEIKWDFDGIIPKERLCEMLEYFERKEFFDTLKPIDGAYDVLKQLSKDNEVIIVSKHPSSSSSLKREWIRKHFPFINRCVFLDQVGMDKSVIHGDVVIDDNLECLESITAKYKICFGDYAYNYYSTYPKANTWLEVLGMLKMCGIIRT